MKLHYEEIKDMLHSASTLLEIVAKAKVDVPHGELDYVHFCKGRLLHALATINEKYPWQKDLEKN